MQNYAASFDLNYSSKIVRAVGTPFNGASSLHTKENYTNVNSTNPQSLSRGSSTARQSTDIDTLHHRPTRPPLPLRNADPNADSNTIASLLSHSMLLKM